MANEPLESLIFGTHNRRSVHCLSGTKFLNAHQPSSKSNWRLKAFLFKGPEYTEDFITVHATRIQRLPTYQKKPRPKARS